MSGRISISRRTARAVRDFIADDTCRHDHEKAPVLAELERALKASEKVRAFRKATKKTKASKRATHNEETAAIRKAVFERAGGRCEAPQPSGFGRCTYEATDLDHFFSRRNGQSVETTWALCRGDHFLKTQIRPSAEFWLEAFAEHCRDHDYLNEQRRAEDRLAFVQARKAVGS